MTAYHRLLPAKSREEDDLHQYVKEPVARDQGRGVHFPEAPTLEERRKASTTDGGTLPEVTTLMTAFDKILAAFNLNNSQGNWFYQTERNKIPMVDVSPEQFHTVDST